MSCVTPRGGWPGRGLTPAFGSWRSDRGVSASFVIQAKKCRERIRTLYSSIKKNTTKIVFLS